MLHLCWLTSYGWAEMVTTSEALTNAVTREMLIDALNREDVQKQLEHYGITKEDAVVRINSLTDEEIGALVKDIDSVPIGGNPLAVLVYGVYLAALLAMYLVTVLFRGIECIFSDCEAKGGLSYVFGGFRKDKNSQSIETEEECDPGMESCI